jgi:hypothetical protein
MCSRPWLAGDYALLRRTSSAAPFDIPPSLTRKQKETLSRFFFNSWVVGIGHELLNSFLRKAPYSLSTRDPGSLPNGHYVRIGSRSAFRFRHSSKTQKPRRSRARTLCFMWRWGESNPRASKILQKIYIHRLCS